MSRATKIIPFTNFRLPSPMRMLRSLHARLIVADGPRIEHDILLEEVNRETDELLVISTEAQQAETGIEHFAATWREALKDGRIDDQELRALQREFLALKAPAHLHTQHIRELL